MASSRCIDDFVLLRTSNGEDDEMKDIRHSPPAILAYIAKPNAPAVNALQGAIDVPVISKHSKVLPIQYYRLGHIEFQHLRWLIWSGAVPVHEKDNVANSDTVQCAVCTYGKPAKHPTKTLVTTGRANNEMEWKKPNVYFLDRRLPKGVFCGGMILVDHAINFIAVRHQVLIKTKIGFEREAFHNQTIRFSSTGAGHQGGVAEQSICTIVTMTHLMTIRFSSTGAGHQGGVAEQSICTIVTMTHLMMINAALRYGSAIKPEDWPQSMEYAVWLKTALPEPQDLQAPSAGTSPTMVSSNPSILVPALVVQREQLQPLCTQREQLRPSKELFVPRELLHTESSVHREQLQESSAQREQLQPLSAQREQLQLQTGSSAQREQLQSSSAQREQLQLQIGFHTESSVHREQLQASCTQKESSAQREQLQESPAQREQLQPLSAQREQLQLQIGFHTESSVHREQLQASCTQKESSAQREQLQESSAQREQLQPLSAQREQLQIGYYNAKSTPCNGDGTPAGTNRNGLLAYHDWTYASVVGMLLYWSSNSRCDIAFAVHQCAKFSHAPRSSHKKTVIRICRYLKQTRDEGIVFRPNKGDLQVDCYVDADFASLYGTEDPMDPTCVKSRTGYVILLVDCPLMWVSRLQTTIALSTQHREYVALSTACRDLIPIRELMIRLSKDVSNLLGNMPYCMKSNSFEDNAACLALAKLRKLTLQNRHIGSKYH
jgi:hypothetical protein